MNDYENNYEYKSATHNITITGLDGRATITGNGTKNVLVAFDVTSSTSSLKNFTITCVNGEQELTYKGLHAHYGTTVTGILTFAYTNITRDGSEGTIGTNYKFVETDSITLPLFTDASTLWNSIYSYQVMNVLMGNYSLSSIGSNFLSNCYSLSVIVYNASVYPTDNNSLSQTTNSKTSSSGAGIIVYGTKRGELISALPNRTSTPFRKLINGGS